MVRVGSALLVSGALMTACSAPGGGELPKAQYDQQTGRLRELAFDANKNGKNDSVSYMDGARLVRIELDLDENGKVDRWDFYGEDRKLEKVGFSRLDDGVMDAVTYYHPDGTIDRILVSSRRDGRFDRTEFYEHNILVRSEEDTNGDSRVDKWETYRPQPGAAANEPAYAITSTAFDDMGTGKPQRRFVYGANGAIARVEVDPDGDGVFSVRSIPDRKRPPPPDPSKTAAVRADTTTR